VNSEVPRVDVVKTVLLHTNSGFRVSSWRWHVILSDKRVMVGRRVPMEYANVLTSHWYCVDLVTAKY
jgi:hypothetical protein